MNGNVDTWYAEYLVRNPWERVVQQTPKVLLGFLDLEIHTVSVAIVFGIQQPLKSCQMCDQEKHLSKNAPQLNKFRIK